MGRGADTFLSAYNRIDQQLNRWKEGDDYIPFASLVNYFSKRNAVIKRFQNDLLEFAELRNAIVHNRVTPNYVIAEPHAKTVDHILYIEEEITRPKLVIPAFEKPVKTFHLDDSLASLLDIVKEKEFSQFPVYGREGFKGLLTPRGITQWLATHIDRNHVNLNGTTIGEVLAVEVRRDYVKFISSKTTVHQAMDMMKGNPDKNYRLEAILITERGRTDEELLGIITPHHIIDES
ncbi:CBS domain-containing protein [Salimicrobium halophilum]|uniref:Predicted transcriptional regulator with C-terminal CBS domains n=1 Tax=Salimicrobium halophilum TaxID=86666 RepID=A0A1G8T4B1_9BACI|nr:CBS domain-containing protein [Salimicrobium halophilum]SDJ36449.1 Predicted transcriptional regulator with C-terminal CBS domains [Salimicrobium halophilum]